MPHFGDYQTEIYFKGLRGVLPSLPADFKLLEQRAQAAMPPSVLSYVQGGCGDEFTQTQNANAFHHWGLVPRMLVDCSTRDLTVDLLGLKLPTPIFLSPIGVLGICTPDGHGDLAVARASAATGVPMIASTLSNDTLEAVAESLGDTPGFFQLYTPKDEALTESLIHRAEAAGFKAIVVTLDTWLLGWRPRDLNAANFPQLRGAALQNYFTDPCFLRSLEKPPEEDLSAAVMQWTQNIGNPLTWKHLPWLRSLTKLPLILKGICHPDDARRAIDAGIEGIYCSNHGGRQAERRRPRDRYAPRHRRGLWHDPGSVRLWGSIRQRCRQGFSDGGSCCRNWTSVRLWSRPCWNGGSDSCSEEFSGRGRPADGHRRLPHSHCSTAGRRCPLITIWKW